jgi:membrane protease YdiL (CAAX protease family)
MTQESTSHWFLSAPDAQAPAREAMLLAFALTALAMLPAQIVRLFQDDALPWLLADYAGRLFALILVFSLPAGQVAVTRTDRLRVGRGEAILWIVGIVAVLSLSGLDVLFGSLFPGTSLGGYPQPGGWLYLFDMTCGLALVALHEELVFRKLAAAALERFFRSEVMLVLVSAFIFALYHWWTGFGNMIACFAFGIAAMSCYRRTGSLWPVGFAHYALDVAAFA